MVLEVNTRGGHQFSIIIQNLEESDMNINKLNRIDGQVIKDSKRAMS